MVDFNQFWIGYIHIYPHRIWINLNSSLQNIIERVQNVISFEKSLLGPHMLNPEHHNSHAHRLFVWRLWQRREQHHFQTGTVAYQAFCPHSSPHYIPLFSAQLTQLYVANLMIASLELLRSCSMEQHIIFQFPYKARTWAPSGKEF